MSRFLVTCWPFTGHVHNQLAIAEELRDGGHEVAFYTGPSARALLEGEGFAVFAFDHLDEQRGYRGMRALEPADAALASKPGAPCGARCATGSSRRCPTSSPTSSRCSRPGGPT